MEAKRPSVKLIVVNDKNEVLIATSSRSGSKKFPGGGIDFGESQKQAAERELREETTLVAISMVFLGTIKGIFSSINTKMAHGLNPGDATEEHYYLIEKYSGTPEAKDDASELEWVPADQITDTLTYDTQKEGFGLWKASH